MTVANPDIQAIGDAIVAQWLYVGGVRSATRRELDGVPNGSHVVVHGDITIEADTLAPLAGRGAGFESMLQHWSCTLYVAPFSHTGTAVDTTIGIVANAFTEWRNGLGLGLDTVEDSYINTARVREDLDVPKATSKYAGCEFDVVVRTRVNVTRYRTRT